MQPSLRRWKGRVRRRWAMRVDWNVVNAVCVCYDSNTGPDCDYSSAEIRNLYVLLVLVLLASIASFAFM